MNGIAFRFTHQQSEQKLPDKRNMSAKLKDAEENMRYEGIHESGAQCLEASYCKRRGSASGVLMGFSKRSTKKKKKTALPVSKIHVPVWIQITTIHIMTHLVPHLSVKAQCVEKT